ncbi:HAMP domain-containing histidine kinase [Paenibacillus sp. HWE-109]|uniref:ATP-binding protein n=1 Tax=Paenibacillus sp. HWE-109 TaxID=1306526 RepID=UPI001EE0A49E|nr:sensor histidine kinase [Paenibacillus sp. HWE-109]UKS26757.1 HAMP domain-containing histidine kinase [Paenibacillus sp. HWE-109]
MKFSERMRSIAFLMIIIGCCYSSSSVHASSQDSANSIKEWSMLWGMETDGKKEISEVPDSKWMKISDYRASPAKPSNISTAWVKLDLPLDLPDQSSILITEIYAQQVSVYLGDQLVHERHYRFTFDVQRILIPINHGDAGKIVYIKLETSLDRLGINSPIKLGNHTELMRPFVVHDLASIIIGCSFICIALIMLICSMYLKRNQIASWLSLSIIFITMGIIFITNAPFTYVYFGDYGAMYSNMFDLSLAIFLPMLSYYFEKVFENGQLVVIRNFRRFQVIYSIFYLLFMVVNQINDYKFNKAYYFMTSTVLGYIMIVQFVLLVSFSVLYAKRGNKDAVIFSKGFAFFALLGTIDLVWYYFSSQIHQLFLWKWGIVGFNFALIIILGRRFAAHQDLLMNYSKELEFYNQHLQASEKMEVISSLTASVAHEIRNPLQVTRGFLQLVSEDSNEKNKKFVEIAIGELDRAAEIITDFLTFAKPQLDEVTELNISKELKQIEGIIVPLATSHGGMVFLNIPTDLYICGNSSKLKQALINIIKNSIEAFQKDGQIHIQAYEHNNNVVIQIKDNGAGIEPAQLAKLGEPYFSTKTKGTGLGLMVTFRLIEAMKGTIEFSSQKHVGTEVMIRFPAVSQRAPE